jgi:hypothetical protein
MLYSLVKHLEIFLNVHEMHLIFVNILLNQKERKFTPIFKNEKDLICITSNLQ